MGKRIAIIQGHPDPAGGHFGHALAASYAAGAESAGHEVRTLALAELNIPYLRTKADFDTGSPPADIAVAQETIAWAGHLVIFYPLWLGTMPAILKAFLEQALRPGFAIAFDDSWRLRKLLKGRSARVVVTMGMPALAYRWWFRAHSLKSLERNILRFCGIAPVRETLIGMVEAMSAEKRERWLVKVRDLGRRGV